MRRNPSVVNLIGDVWSVEVPGVHVGRKKDSFMVLNLKVWVNLRFAKVQILESLLYETMAFLVGAL